MTLRYVTAGLVGLSLMSFASLAAAEVPASQSPAAAPIDRRDAFPGETGHVQPAAAAAPAVAIPAAAPAVAAPAASPAATVTATTPAAATVDPLILAVRARLADKALIGKASPAGDVAALAAFYGARPDALWIAGGTYNDRAKAVMAELQKAEDWGLEAADFVVSSLAPGAAPDAQAAAEVELGA